VICGPPDAREFVESAGVEFRPIGVSVRQFLTANAQAVTGNAAKLAGATGSYFKTVIEKQFEMLPEATRGADLIVGAGVQIAGGSVAEYLGIPYRYVCYCPAMIPSAAHAPFVVEWQDLPPWLNRALWWGFRALDWPIRRSLNRHRARLGLAPARSAFEHLLATNVLLASWRELAPMPADSPYAAEQVGYLHPELGDPLPEKLEDFLESGPPPVYLGFGSMTDPNAARTTQVLLDTVSKLDCRAIVSQGWAGLGEGPLPEGVMTVPSVCHGRLFPRCAAVVHHGGAGTTSTAARAGVPQVVVPHLADQFYWARRISLLGLGPPGILRRRLDSACLAEALRFASEEVVVERARGMGESLRAQDPVARTVASLTS